jgi:hypothetical protein
MSRSDFARAVREFGVADPQVALGVRLTTLSPSLLADLDRFESGGASIEPLEVLAACIRHARPLVMFLELGGRVMHLRMFPTQGLFACPSDFLGLPEAHVRQLRCVRIEPGVSYRPTEPPGSGDGAERTGPLLLLLWQVAMFGSRSDPLPEIDGRACYRVSPALNIDMLPTDAAVAPILRRMRRKSLTLDDVASEPGMGIERACRLLNAVYLQAGLVTLRASPDARHSSLLAVFARGSR